MMGGDWAYGHFGPFGGIVLMIFWILIVLVVVLLVRWLLTRPSADADPNRETAHQKVERRYASGEIDRDTYLCIKADLGDEVQ